MAPIDYVSLDIPCPKCRKISKQLVRELVANDTIHCTYCGDVIDVSSKDWRARIAEAEKTLREIKPPPFI